MQKCIIVTAPSIYYSVVNLLFKNYVSAYLPKKTDRQLFSNACTLYAKKYFLNTQIDLSHGSLMIPFLKSKQKTSRCLDLKIVKSDRPAVLWQTVQMMMLMIVLVNPSKPSTKTCRRASCSPNRYCPWNLVMFGLKKD